MAFGRTDTAREGNQDQERGKQQNDTIPGPELNMVMGKATRQENDSVQLFLDDETMPRIQ